jgi:hypothetical protein
MSILIRRERSYGCGGRLIRGFVGKSISDLIDQRLKTKDILQKLTFVSLVVRHPTGLVQLEDSYEVNKTSESSSKIVSNEDLIGTRGKKKTALPHTISTAAVHSSTVISFSLAKSCKCLNKLGITCASLAFAFGPVAAITESVNVGLKREVFVESAPLVALLFPLAGTLGPDSSGTRFRGSSTFMVGMLGRMKRRCLEWGGEKKKSLMAPRMRRRVEDW